ncbi:MAG: tetratricopeptide repeat protein [Alistipes senegalensis]|nr:tetratricopeptide repeat protein [Bacteroides cellulosilyticus]MCM1351404.1 tetratricopeptide repeat protein [Alistipes senegalensis]
MRISIPLFVLALLCATSGYALTPETSRCMQRGRELFEYGRWSDARHAFRQARAELDPTDHAAIQETDYYLAACAVELGSADAAAALQTFERNYPTSTYLNDVRFALASYYCAVGNFDLAADAFRTVDRAALSASRREQYDFRMGYLAFNDADYAGMYDHLNRIPANSELADHAAYYKAYVDYIEGRTGRALQGFGQLSQSEAYGDVAPYFLLQLAFREGDYRYIVGHGDELAAQAPAHRKVEIERIVAEAWFRQENYDAAIAHLRSYFDAGGETNRETAYLMGFSLYRLEHYAEAAEWLRKAVGTGDALSQNASYHLAGCYLHTGDKQAALQSFAIAAATTDDAAIAEDAQFNYARLLYESGGSHYSSAIRLLQQYIERYPDSPRLADARSLLIAAYYNSRDYDAAYRAIRSLSSTDADTRAALQKIAYFRGLNAYHMGDRTAAGTYLSEAAAVNVSPKYTALSNFWQGEIAFEQGNYGLAATKYEQYLRRAPQSEPEYVMAWYNLGYCAFSQECMADAETHFQKFLALHRSNDRYRSDTYNRLGDIRYADRRFKEAVEQYDKAIALGGEAKHYARYQRAMTYGLMEKPELKRQALNRIIADGEGIYVEAAQFELGHSAIAGARYAEGAATLVQFIKQYPASVHRSQALADLGLAYFNLGDRNKALEYYNQIVASAPHSAEARDAMQGIRDIYISRGDADAYFDYAAKAGVESDLTLLARDSLSFAAAQKLYITESGTTAAKSLRSYLLSYPKGYYRRDALYLLSDCYLRNGQRKEAIGTLTELSKEENNPYTLKVLTKLSEMTFAARRYPEAAVAYRKLYDVAPTAAERQEAMTGYVRATVSDGDAARIRTMAEDVRRHADAGTTARREATFALAEQHRTAGKTANALALYKELSGEVRSVEGSAASYYLLEDTFRKGDAARTEQAIFAYSEREPKPYWLAKAYLLLGEVYLRKGDEFQARATWQSIVNGYSPADDGIVEEAAARIRKLK